MMDDLYGLNLRTASLLALFMGLGGMVGRGAAVPGPENPVDFNRDIRPIFNNQCVACHGGVKRSSGLSLLFRDEALKAHDSGNPGILPGDPESSELFRRITHADPEERMPPEEAPLTPRQVDLITRWIRAGAPWADHWAYVPPSPVTPPVIEAPQWARNGIDQFVAKRLSGEGLTPSPAADPATLLRRVSLDLTGLPPTPEEVRSFLGDPTDGAYERAVDRLLASPGYGERWAGMWLDLARYADTKGYEADRGRTIWRYRDWLIEAFNRDMPFDQFTVDQLAGDLLPDATPEQILATALHRNTMTNDEGGTDDEEYRVAAVMDRVNTTWEIWMGTTFSCVQCHGHPYDPFTHEDYYRFFAFFNQTADADRADDTPTLATLSPPERRKRDELLARATHLEEDLAHRASEPDIRATYHQWVETLAAQPNWIPFIPESAASGGGATLEIGETGEIRVGGTNPPTDQYTLSGPTGLASVTGLRLVTLPHAELNRGGAGRSPDGNFVLSGISAAVARPGSPSIPGRFLRLTLPGPDRLLSLAEVQVLGPAGDVLSGGTPTQSSTDYRGDAARARDNDTRGDYQAESTTHTRKEADPWWELDLGETRDLQEILIWNRTDGGHHRRSDGLRIIILDNDRSPVWTQQVLRATAEPHRFAIREGAIPFAAAYATHAQPGFPIVDAVHHADPGRKGWAVAPRVAESHHAAFLFAESVPTPADAEMIIRLDHQYHQGRFSLGHFQLQLSDDPRLPARAGLPPGIQEALDRPPDHRTPQQEASLLQAFAQTDSRLQDLAMELEDTRTSMEALVPVPTPVMQELPAEQRRATHLFERGNWLAPADPVTAGVPATLPPMPPGTSPDRLGMAQWMVHPEHPLTARVAVNRFWEQLFGVGLVDSLEDFGTQGSKPSHPDLLDWLAREFVHNHGWSVKQSLKQMVMSATYRQASHVTPELLERDPANRLLARGPRFRLSAEQIRDQALAASGLLHPAMFGPSVMPPQPENLWQSVYSGDQWTVASGPDRYRRALYTYWKRTSPYPSMTTFDAPSREVCLARRIRTNTPLQALVTLNDPVFVEAAQHLADRIWTEGGDTPEARIRYGFTLVRARGPSPDDVADMQRLYEDGRRHYREHPEAAHLLARNPDLAAFTLVAGALLNLDSTLTRE